MKTLFIVIVGLALAFAGWYVSTEVHLAFQESLASQGIPLDLGKTVSMIGMFLILFPVLNMFYFKPLGDAIHGRTTELERTFAEATEMRAEMAQLKSDYEKRIVQTEAEARESIQATIREAQSLRDQLRSDAVKQAEELKKTAIAEIEQEKQKIMGDLRLHVVNLTLQATERLVGESMDDAKSRRLVEEFIDKVEATA
ncbi:MAG: F0F1 ATP synthase subunit B [Armatimonadetes bacterium]|nr:F0F1 ATP synthase subunit B [Armatimonadota bacterium]